MWRFRLPAVLVAGLIVGTFAIPAAAQFACTSPNDPACNHLKCYQIKDAPITVNVQVDTQFDREAFIQLQPVLLCTPAEKSCCIAGAGCSPNNCKPNPVPAPGLPHFKCYKFRGRTVCSDPACTSTAKFPKGTVVTLTDQFGVETNVAVGKPVIFCAPADKRVMGQTTTTATTTSTTTTTRVPPCHFDTTTGACSGPCPPNSPPGAQCQLVAPMTCRCVLPPVCCQCSSTAGPACFDTNGPCPPACATLPNAICNANTGQCSCGLCRDPANTTACSTTPCSTGQPCPNGMVCDPVHCPAPCDPCTGQTSMCTAQCIKVDGTVAQCHPIPGSTPQCSCCSFTGGPCTTNTECCSGVCNAATLSCQ